MAKMTELFGLRAPGWMNSGWRSSKTPPPRAATGNETENMWFDDSPDPNKEVRPDYFQGPMDKKGSVGYGNVFKGIADTTRSAAKSAVEPYQSQSKTFDDFVRIATAKIGKKPTGGLLKMMRDAWEEGVSPMRFVRANGLAEEYEMNNLEKLDEINELIKLRRRVLKLDEGFSKQPGDAQGDPGIHWEDKERGLEEAAACSSTGAVSRDGAMDEEFAQDAPVSSDRKRGHELDEGLESYYKIIGL